MTIIIFLPGSAIQHSIKLTKWYLPHLNCEQKNVYYDNPRSKENGFSRLFIYMGFQPAKISGNNCWYYSPLHDEKTPSFKVNWKMNRWYDFSEGKGKKLLTSVFFIIIVTLAIFYEGWTHFRNSYNKKLKNKNL